jgi:hypothetical protein
MRRRTGKTPTLTPRKNLERADKSIQSHGVRPLKALLGNFHCLVGNPDTVA